ncbi:MAG: Cof-type HAD-IIB family hydrolase [Sphaerochaetaceae bacterium]
MQTDTPIKAIAIDLDGTLLTSDKQITPYTLEVLSALKGQGIHISIATGRSLATTIRFIEQVGTNFPAVLYNGSCLWDPLSATDVWHTALEHDICSQIVALGATGGAKLHAFMNHQLYFDENDRHADTFEPLSAVVGKAVNFASLGPLSFTKAMFLGPPEQTKPIREQLHSQFGNRIHTVYSHPTFLEVMSQGATKGAALERLMKLHGIDSAHVAVFGDADNDVEMLKWAGFSYAMANASEAVKQVADEIILGNDEEGVAKKLAQLLH